jgi:transcriptional regulator with XRE-family HTH domain
VGDTAFRRHKLAAFLRSRRERITPEDAGLPSGHRRRTAGLRREEVAQLSGVGVTWYTWLQQGRPIRASVQVLEAVARTLRLDAIERQHLLRLAEVPDTAHPDESGPVLGPQIQVVLDGLSPMPASPEFEAIWATQDVAQPAYYAKVFRHPLYPRLEMTSTSFAVQTVPGTRLVVYTPDNVATRMAMEQLVADPVQHHFPCWPAHQARTRDLLTV